MSEYLRFDGIIGCEDAKAHLLQAAGAVQSGFTTRILLHGVPGIGKSTLSKQFAEFVKWPNIRILLPEVVTRGIDATTARLRKKFDDFKEAAAQGPALLLLDELEILDPTYSGGCFGSLPADAAQALVEEFTCLLPHVGDGGSVVVIACTQVPWGMHPELLKCFDFCVHLPLPTKDDQVCMFETQLHVFMERLIEISRSRSQPVDVTKMIQPSECACFGRRCSECCEPGCTYSDMSGSCRRMLMTLFEVAQKSEDELLFTVDDLQALAPEPTMASISKDAAARHDQWQEEMFPCTLLTLISVSITAMDKQSKLLSFHLISGDNIDIKVEANESVAVVAARLQRERYFKRVKLLNKFGAILSTEDLALVEHFDD